MADETPIEQLKGLGPRSAALLKTCGIESIEQLRDLGPIFAYATLQRGDHSETRNLLWAIAAGLEDRHWTSLTGDEKETLLDELEQLTR